MARWKMGWAARRRGRGPSERGVVGVVARDVVHVGSERGRRRPGPRSHLPPRWRRAARSARSSSVQSSRATPMTGTPEQPRASQPLHGGKSFFLARSPGPPNITRGRTWAGSPVADSGHSGRLRTRRSTARETVATVRQRSGGRRHGPSPASRTTPHRRRPDGRPGRPGRLDRLVVRAPDSTRRLVSPRCSAPSATGVGSWRPPGKRERSSVLSPVTRWCWRRLATETGAVVVIDFMPRSDREAPGHRRVVRGLEGTVAMRSRSPSASTTARWSPWVRQSTTGSGGTASVPTGSAPQRRGDRTAAT